MVTIGLGYGAFSEVYPGLTADQFGQKHQGINYGIMFIGLSIAGIVGPLVASQVYLRNGTYSIAFAIGAGLCVVGIVTALFFRKIIKVRAVEK